MSVKLTGKELSREDLWVGGKRGSDDWGFRSLLAFALLIDYFPFN
jgi:hypothetical protein